MRHFFILTVVGFSTFFHTISELKEAKKKGEGNYIIAEASVRRRSAKEKKTSVRVVDKMSRKERRRWWG